MASVEASHIAREAMQRALHGDLRCVMILTFRCQSDGRHLHMGEVNHGHALADEGYAALLNPDIFSK